METVVLKCGTDIVLHACDTAWTADAATPSVDGSDYKEGTGSMTVTTSGTGLQCHGSLSSTDISAKTHIQFYIKSSASVAANKFTFRVSIVSDCSASYDTLNSPSLVAGVWTLCVLELSIASVLTQVKSVGIAQNTSGNVTLHIDNVLAVDARSFDTYGVRGFDDLDSVRLWPGAQNVCPNGEVRTRVTAWGRMPQFMIAPTTAKQERVWLVVSFAQSSTRAMIYADEEISVAFQDPVRPFKSEWLRGTPLARGYQMNLIEQTVRTARPDAWA